MNGQIETALTALQEIQFFSLIVVDNCKWLLPQSEIRSVGSLIDIDPAVCAPSSIGAIGFEGEWWPVYCLTGEFQLLPALTASRQVCLLLNNGADNFGMVCDRIEPLGNVPTLAALPDCMRLPQSPIRALALLKGEVSCVTTTEGLAELIAVKITREASNVE